MAKRESQGLQIALIVFVMITVLFMVTTVLFWKSADTAKKERDDYESRAANASTERSRMEDENRDIKEKLLGYPPDAPYEQIEKDVSEKILAYGAGLREEQRNLVALPEQMANALSVKNDRIKKLSDIESDLKKQMESIRQMANSKVTSAQTEQQKAIAERAAESQKHTQVIQRQQTEQQKRDDAYRATLAAVEGEKSKKDEEIAEQGTALVSLGRANERLTEELDQYENATLTVPDGVISWVSQPAGLVWINLGEADGVRPQMTFNVFDVDANDLARSKLKGRIEILRVVDESSSEAQILADELSNPMMTGDVIDSHIWQRGQHLRFALAGIMDVDEDGTNDRDLVKQLIEMNGGIVDSMMDDNGSQTGPMSVHTRYLIVGDSPPSKDSVATKGYMDMQNQARTLGVDKISYTQILDFIGYDGKGRSVPMGKSARAVDFKAKPRDGVVQRPTGGVSALYDPKQRPFRRLSDERTSLD